MIISPEILPLIMSRLRYLPARPEAHQQVIRTLGNPASSTHDIAIQINQDVALTAHILKMANSAAFSPAQKINSTHEAITIIGTLRLKALVSTAWAFRLMDDSQHVLGFDPKAECDHALAVGMVCLELADEARCNPETREEAFSAGLLHDLGKILIAINLPEVYAAVSEETAAGSIPRWRVERELMGFDHAEIGGGALESWQMAAPIVDAVKHHHAPGLESRQTVTPLTLVHLANSRVRDVLPEAGCLECFRCAKKNL
jgi:HD-like signal output (HDOD) protein